MLLTRFQDLVVSKRLRMTSTPSMAVSDSVLAAELIYQLLYYIYDDCNDSMINVQQ